MMRVIMADQAARVRRAVVRDRKRAVGSDDPNIKIHQAFAGDVARLGAHPVAGMASRARESVLLNMAGVFAEAGNFQDPREIVAFSAQSIGAAARAPLGAQAGVRKQVGDGLARDPRLTELVTALQDVRKN